MTSAIAEHHDVMMAWLQARSEKEIHALAYHALEPRYLALVTGCFSCATAEGLCYGCGRAPCVCLCLRCKIRAELKRRAGAETIRQVADEIREI